LGKLSLRCDGELCVYILGGGGGRKLKTVSEKQAWKGCTVEESQTVKKGLQEHAAGLSILHIPLIYLYRENYE